MPLKKVTQVLYAGLGGHSSVAFSLKDADRNDKWDHSMLFYGIEQMPASSIDFCKSKAVHYGYVKKNPGLSAGSYLAAYRYLRSAKADVVLLHMPALVLVGWWYCLWNRATLVVVEHNPNQIKRKSEWFCSFLSLVLAAKVVYLSGDYKTEIKKKLGVFFRERKTKVIPNGIDITAFSPGTGDPAGPVVISMAARFSTTKDQQLLINAFNILVARGSGVDLQLVLAGDGETRQALEETAMTSKGSNIRFAGMLNMQELIDLFHQTTVYVHATHSETMSTSIMQALACGLPVVASDVPGVSNLINGQNGWLYPPSDAEHLAILVSRLLADPDARQQLSHNARLFAVEQLSSDRMFLNYDQVVQN